MMELIFNVCVTANPEFPFKNFPMKSGSIYPTSAVLFNTFATFL